MLVFMERNKLLLFVLVGMFMISLASALEFDNVIEYKEDYMKVDIENTWGFDIPFMDDYLGSLELKSHKTYDEVVTYGWGKEEVVMYYDFTGWDSYENGFGEVIFINETSGEQIKREYTLVEWGSELRSHNINGKCISQLKNGTCTSWETVKEDYIFEGWFLLENNIIENKRVGIKTHVYEFDHIDTIMTIAGKRIDLHASWNASREVGIMAYYQMEEAAGPTGPVIDYFNQDNMTNAGAANKTGKIGSGYDFNSDGMTINDLFLGVDEFTISFWFKSDVADSTEQRLLGYNTDGVYLSMGVNTGSPSLARMYCRGASGGGWTPITALPNSSVVTDWNYYTMTAKENDYVTAYVNGHILGSPISITTFVDTAGGYRNLGQLSGSSYADGVFDEVSFHNRSLSLGEIQQMYNDGNGMTPSEGPIDTYPQITLISPVNEANLTSANQEFITVVTDSEEVVNVSLLIGGIIQQTNSSGINGTYSFAETISEGYNNWSVLSCNNRSLCNESAPWFFNYTKLPIMIDLQSPSDLDVSEIPSINMSCNAYEVTGVLELNLTVFGETQITVTNSTPAENLSISQFVNFSEGNYTWGCSARNAITDAASANRTFQVLYSSPIITLLTPENNTNFINQNMTFSFNVTDINGIENVSYYINEIIEETNTSGFESNYHFKKTLPEGVYNWSARAVSVLGKITDSVINSFIVHTTEPAIDIIQPADIEGYFILGNNQTLEYSITESGENLTEHLVDCWYVYDSTNYSLNCTGTETEFNYTNGINNISVYAEDSFGLVAEDTKNWIYQFIETNRTVDAVALQTGRETLQLVGIKDSSVINANAILHYNGFQYASVKTGSGNDVIFTNIIDVPSGVIGNVSIYWEITYSNSTGSFQFNSTNSTQEVFSINFTECFAPSVDGLTLNFTTYDTTNETELNSTFEATFQYYADGGTGESVIEYLFSDLDEDRSNYMFCLSAGGQNATLDAFISYSAADHDRREYILDDAIIGNFTQNIPLYLTATELTDIVTVTVQDQTFDPITNALVAIQEWNVGTNTYSTIGMLTTSSSGQGIIDLELYTTWYRAVVYIDGVLTHVEDVTKLSSTSWIITVETGEDNPYDLFGNIVHGLTFDNVTNITSFTWLDTSGYTSRGCLVVHNQTNLGPVTIFDSCTTSVSGTINFLIVGDGSFTAYGVIFLQGYNTTQITDVLPIQKGTPLISQTVSPFGKVISFITIGTAGLIGVAAGSTILGGILLIAVLVFLMKMGFMNITWGFVWGIISIMILVWALQRRKR